MGERRRRLPSGVAVLSSRTTPRAAGRMQRVGDLVASRRLVLESGDRPAYRRFYPEGKR
jgi:hypothetical protein